MHSNTMQKSIKIDAVEFQQLFILAIRFNLLEKNLCNIHHRIFNL